MASEPAVTFAFEVQNFKTTVPLQKMLVFNLEVSQKSAAFPGWDWESLGKEMTLDVSLKDEDGDTDK